MFSRFVGAFARGSSALQCSARSARSVSIRSFATPHHALNASSQNPADVTPDIRGQLKGALKAAMKGKDKEAMGCIRTLMSDITYHEKAQANPNEPASEESVVEVLRKAVAKRKDASSTYPSDHPTVSQLAREISLISSFLPSTLSSAELRAKLEPIVRSLTEEEKSSKGAMGIVLKRFWDESGVSKGQVEDKKGLGKVVQELLKA